MAENSEPSARNRGSGRPFGKGQSGNPGGRPKLEGEIRKLAQKHGPAAIKRLVDLMDSSNERVAVAAAQAVLDRAYGKPPQGIHLKGDGTAPHVMQVEFIRAKTQS
jgi:hypothetical protein